MSDFQHRCPDNDCIYIGQPSAPTCKCHKSVDQMMRDALAEAGRGAIAIRNELDRTRAERDSWEAQFHAAAAAASEYSAFWEEHNGDFDSFGNYIPYSQMDGDLRAAKAEIERLRDLVGTGEQP